MSWRLVTDEGRELVNVTSFQLEQQIGKPAVFSWGMLKNSGEVPERISLFYEETCLLRGNVLRYPLGFNSGGVKWGAVAAPETLALESQKVLNTLDQESILEGSISGVRGGKAGHLFVDPVSHQIFWDEFIHPKVTIDITELYDKESRVMTPLDPGVKGVRALVLKRDTRELSGMMDLGPYLTERVGGSLDTYSGNVLETEFERLSFRLMRAGYDVHAATLETLARRRRVDIPNYLSLQADPMDSKVLPLQSYTAKLLCSWRSQVKRQHTIMLTWGDGTEVLNLRLRDGVEASSTEAVVQALHKWMRSYLHLKSFNTKVKLSLSMESYDRHLSLGVGQWVKMYDAIIQRWIEGPIIGRELRNEGGRVVLDLTMLWAEGGTLKISDQVCKISEDGDSIQLPGHPSDIISNVGFKNDAVTQHAYVKSGEVSMLEEFPMSRLELEVIPMPLQMVEYTQTHYQC